MKARPFDKYDLYFRAVQNPEADVDFIERRFREVYGRLPRVLGEDFCGTFAISCFWAKRGRDRKVVGVDRDREPIAYGKKHYLPFLTPEERKRVTIIQDDVRAKRLPRVDVLAALNFSYFGLRSREDLLAYFRNARRRVGTRGLFLLDCFGGSGTLEPNQETKSLPGFTYYFDQRSFDPITGEGRFCIHFKRRGERKRERVFAYDWRLWTLPELRDLLREAGFETVDVYWEDTDDDGEGTGIYRRRARTESQEGWVAYLVAHPRR